MPFYQGPIGANKGLKWNMLLVEYIGDAPGIWKCPSGQKLWNYAKNSRTGMYADSLPDYLSHQPVFKVVDPSGTFYFSDGLEKQHDGWVEVINELYPGKCATTNGVGFRHMNRANFVFIDGHVKDRSIAESDTGWGLWFSSPLWMIEK